MTGSFRDVAGNPARRGGVSAVMDLLGAPLLIVAAGAALGSVLATVLVWEVEQQRHWSRWLTRAGLLLSCQLTALLAVGLAVNNVFGFYVSWSDLLGHHQQFAPAAVHAGAVDERYRAVLVANWLRQRGTVVPLPIPGQLSRIPAEPAYAYLPPQYGDPAYAKRSFPVVELLDGYPGSPRSWLQTLHLQQVLDREINAGRTVPMIAVMPTQNVATPRDTECTNVPHGPQVETYLTYDVRQAVLREFRASVERRSWAVMGYSTGGYCAINLLLHHSSLFSVAASMSGYYSPLHDPTIGDLYGKSRKLRLYYTPIWYERHARPEPSELLVMATRGDAPSSHLLGQFLAHLGPTVQATSFVLSRGGHNFGVWNAEEPACLDWVGHQVTAPLAAGLSVSRVRPPPVRISPSP
ncbi:MAG: alpha/beta hydrolase-fold protein [Actinomycetota bacterium]|nr:alpha/beta hydrolase-fold protein [Actinomycetota bacterium]